MSYGVAEWNWMKETHLKRNNFWGDFVKDFVSDSTGFRATAPMKNDSKRTQNASPFTVLHFLFPFLPFSSTLIFKIFLFSHRKLLEISPYNSYPSQARLSRFKRLFLIEFQQLLNWCELSLRWWKCENADGNGSREIRESSAGVCA